MPTSPRLCSPNLLLSSGVSPFLSVASLARVAATAGYGGLDLHLPLWPWTNLGLADPTWLATERRCPPVVALWLPADGHEFLSNDRPGGNRHLRALLALRPQRVVLELAPSMLAAQPRAEIAGMVESVRRIVNIRISITVALKARSLVGGRAHLAQLTLLRRLAGEWDFDIALDLIGKVDPRWEAEAAIVRLGSRLRLVRVGGPAVVGRWTPDSRLPARSLAAVLQRPEAIQLSLEPPIRPWQRASPSAVHSAARKARLSVGAQIEKYHEQWTASADVDFSGRPIRHPERP